MILKNRSVGAVFYFLKHAQQPNRFREEALPASQNK